MINAGLKKSDLHADFRPFFADSKYQVVIIPRGMRLWKLTAYSIPKVGETNWKGEKATVSPWWANVYPFQQDRKGIHARIEEAKLNKVGFKDYMRFVAAVRIDWNMLSNYQEITLNDECLAFWGLFGPTGVLSAASEVADRGRASWENARDVQLPAVQKRIELPSLLGGLDDAFQLYIPGIYPEMLTQAFSKNLHDKGTIQISAFGAHVVGG
ncbi:hypothetical protein ACQW02_04885 [Humitalea sp. 24SJ18S-53]|uniref:hypothetical protein n=1 Tax=Humitalea sp. 24SJ18S-53 TaxID=3422307 RepID=UPI003D665104